MDKISVIVPVYNTDKYLAKCLDSVINQTYRELEIIIIDDGSKDDSASICDKYALLDKRIHVIHQNNQGVSAARNIGLKLSTGKWISFIDSDDTLDLDMYEVMISMASKYNAQIIHCGYKHIVNNEVRLIHGTGQIYFQNNADALSCLISGRLFNGGLWNKLYLRDAISDLTFDVTLKNNEDILFNYLAFSNSDQSLFIDETKYNYFARIGESTIYTLSELKKIHDTVSVNEYIYSHSGNDQLKKYATDRYLQSLCFYYRVCKKYNNYKECDKTKDLIWRVYSNADNICRNMKITVWLINFCEPLYLFLHFLHDKVRKPHWEARKYDEK